jgi:hypothetical protein
MNSRRRIRNLPTTVIDESVFRLMNGWPTRSSLDDLVGTKQN